MHVSTFVLSRMWRLSLVLWNAAHCLRRMFLSTMLWPHALHPCCAVTWPRQVLGTHSGQPPALWAARPSLAPVFAWCLAGAGDMLLQPFPVGQSRAVEQEQEQEQELR